MRNSYTGTLLTYTIISSVQLCYVDLVYAFEDINLRDHGLLYLVSGAVDTKGSQIVWTTLVYVLTKVSVERSRYEFHSRQQEFSENVMVERLKWLRWYKAVLFLLLKLWV